MGILLQTGAVGCRRRVSSGEVDVALSTMVLGWGGSESKLAPFPECRRFDRRVRLSLETMAMTSRVISLLMAACVAAGTFPWGPTVPEMAAFMRSLGCARAMLLDGGLSGQVAVRQRDGSVKQWTNWRAVPLGLIVSPRTPARGPVQAARRLRDGLDSRLHQAQIAGGHPPPLEFGAEEVPQSCAVYAPGPPRAGARLRSVVFVTRQFH